MTGLEFALQTNEGWVYDVESTEDAAAGTWSVLTTFHGSGKIQTLKTDALGSASQFFRVRVHRSTESAR